MSKKRVLMMSSLASVTVGVILAFNNDNQGAMVIGLLVGLLIVSSLIKQ